MFENMAVMFVTLSVFQPDKSRLVKLLALVNVFPMCVTLLVLKCETSRF